MLRVVLPVNMSDTFGKMISLGDKHRTSHLVSDCHNLIIILT
jgi:hypothetical protein